MRKTVWTLNIGDYAPDLCTLTYPLILAYAQKIGADFRIINARAFPERYPVTYEKLQIFDIGRGNDWNVYIDSDALIFPDLFDVTERVGKNTVVHYARDHAGNRFRYDNFFRRDGRDIGSANWFAVASDWCIDLWRPLDDISLLDALAAIKPIVTERQAGIDSAHLIDDYTLSRNIARFGLKHTTVLDVMAKAGDQGMYAFHTHRGSLKQKTDLILGMVKSNLLDHLSEMRECEGMKLGDWMAEYGTAKFISLGAAANGDSTRR